ncbi:DoxX family protein [Nitrosopumilus sp.]|uniref:DoxX family protein n=1 Tax=Nitrosopumilus sp. TaxID=2024843 RepID=UPI002931A4AF|nr:DoxX family protein [Nitrosopumilus sp.]
MATNAGLSSKYKLNDIAFWGLRAAVGVIFIAHGIPKLNPGFSGFLSSIGMPPEAQIPIALLEIVGGTVLIVGVLSRISAAMLSMNMIGAIFVVREASSLTGDGGYELDLILLAACLVIIVAGPGKVSISHVVKKIPRFLH